LLVSGAENHTSINHPENLVSSSHFHHLNKERFSVLPLSSSRLFIVHTMAILTNGVANGNRREDVDISVALRPNDEKSVPGLVKDIYVAGNSLSADDNAGRLRLLEKARDLVRALETPRETMIKHLWAQVSMPNL
jgi:hypothetical protein